MTDAPPTEPSAEYEFTNDWFSPNIPVWRQIVDGNKPARILEIGSFEGRSTCWLIEACAALADIEVVCVDTWDGGAEHQKGGGREAEMSEVEARFHRNIAIAKARASHEVEIRLCKDLSSQALADLIAERRPEPFDLVYIDGSHQAPDVLTDAVMAFQLLKVGGVMIFDDYLWSMDRPGTQDVLMMPKPAIDAFINIFQRKMNLFTGAPLRQLYARKIAA
jgi:predicted O-methyltransferase YrrM